MTIDDSAVLDWLIREKDFDLRYKAHDGETLLHLAARSNNAHLCQLLIDAGADVNAQCRYSWTPLHEAVGRAFNSFVGAPFEWSFETVRCLVEAGADVNHKNAVGVKVLTAAIESGRNNDSQRGEIIDYLKSKGALQNDNR